MGHEVSETVEVGGKWRNVYGRKTKLAGEPLPRHYEFEKDEYDTLEEAVAASKERSRRYGEEIRAPMGAF